MQTAPRLPERPAFLLNHALLIPGALALAALLARECGLDHELSSLVFDSQSSTFPARGWVLLEMLGHHFSKSLVLAVWLMLLVTAFVSSVLGSADLRLARERRVLWTTVVAMAVGPCIVVMLKELNAYHCPADLKSFGGYADYASDWFVARADIGHCFPGGHAAGGFSLIALYFAGVFTGRPNLARGGLWACILAGTAFSLVRMLQGAHFLSHNLWSAAICWAAAALVFAPLAQSRSAAAPAQEWSRA